MKKVLLYSFLLIFGLIASQFLGNAGAEWINAATMLCLAFIMIHVGYEFEISQSKPKQYVWDYLIAGTAALFPWLLCAAYFFWGLSMQSWTQAFLHAKFASPTSAGVLFSMLAAAGLSATWVFRKARILAIFDDLNTILLMIPLKIMIYGLSWQLVVVVFELILLLGLAWRFLHQWKLPLSWPWVLFYSLIITGFSEFAYWGSQFLGDVVTINLEVLLVAFIFGCMLARPKGEDPHQHDQREGHQHGLSGPREQQVASIVAGLFMVLVGLSTPSIAYSASDWVSITFHVLCIALLSNLGKMFPVFCYKKEATFRERLALAVALFPRGEFGAGVLIVSMSYGLRGDALTVAVLSLALNLSLTGLFIFIVKRLIGEKG